MKLRIDIETYEFLSDLTVSTHRLFDDLLSGTEQLLHTYSVVSDGVGPHQDQIDEMFEQLGRLRASYEDDLHELASIFASTAVKMESFLHCAPNSAIRHIIASNKSEDLLRRFAAAKNVRISDPASDATAVFLYKLGEANIRIADYKFKDTPRYIPSSGAIFLDAAAELHDPTGSMSGYFHEVGHMLDHLFANGHAWLSSAPEYLEALQRDFEVNVQKVMTKYSCSKEEAFDLISDELYGVWNAYVSDICGSLSECRCQGLYGHEPKYWKEDPSRIAAEAFANMFESSIGSEEKIEQMELWFPSSYKCFKRLIKEAIDL